MLNYLNRALFVVILLGITLCVQAADRNSLHIIVAPNCLITKLTHFKILSAKDSFSLIQIKHEDIAQLIDAKVKQTTPCGGFMDVSQDWKAFTKDSVIAKDAESFLTEYLPSKQSVPFLARPHTYRIRYQNQVDRLIAQLNPENMWHLLTTFSNFWDRYADSDNGIKAAEWIKTQINMYANSRQDVAISTIPTGMWHQPSIVVKVGASNEPGIVVGAHMDTLSGMYSRKPGADDDGTGSVTVLEIARTILTSDLRFKKPIYFIWYAAEEEGLVGSGYVTAEFKKKKIPVAAVMQLDMTGYAYKNDPTIWLMEDYVDKSLTSYVHKLINTYVKQPVKFTRCGYACSDHARWSQRGFAACMPAEAAFQNTNPNLHTLNDTLDKLALDHMKDYAKLALAFTVELAEPLNDISVSRIS